MLEKRNARRMVYKRPCWAQFEPTGGLYPCEAHNISTEGAKLSGEFPDNVPDRFIIRFAVSGKVNRKCLLVWREGSTIGVQFYS